MSVEQLSKPSTTLKTKLQGRFITLEGIEGVGKSTALCVIQQYLVEQAQLDVLVTREPGGTEIAEAIRKVSLAHYQEAMLADTELMLMFAARAQHIGICIRPALQAGQWVICDRFTDASYAYQGGGRGIPLARISALEEWVQGQFYPDLTILLDAPVSLALSRIKQRGQLDRIEKEQEIFFQRVRECYLARAMQHPERYKIVDASGSQAIVQKELHTICAQLINQSAASS